MKKNIALPAPYAQMVLLGAGGHAKVLYSLALAAGYKVIGVCDPALALTGEKTWLDIPVLGDDDALSRMGLSHCGLINGIGHTVGSIQRKNIFLRLSSAGYSFPPLVHPSAYVDKSVALANGTQIMAGAIIQPGSTIGENVIINTRAVVEHDCSIGDNTHIAPGAVLCGGVCVQQGAFIGAGAVVIQGRKVGAESIVGAGTTLTHDLGSGVKIVPAPVRLKFNP